MGEVILSLTVNAISYTVIIYVLMITINETVVLECDER